MAFSEPLDVLLDFATPQSAFVSPPPLSPLSSSPSSTLSSDDSAARLHGSSGDESGVTASSSTSSSSWDAHRPRTDLLSTMDFSFLTPSRNSSVDDDLPMTETRSEEPWSGTERGDSTRQKEENMPRKRATTTKDQAQGAVCWTATRTINNLPPCRVCADAASGFHYGVNSCEACKRFFSRALKRKRLFKCKGTKNCLIQGKKHNLCGYCRYARCLAMGMSKTAIKTGRYTQEKRAQDTQEVQRLESAHTRLNIAEAEVTEIVQRLIHAHVKMVTNYHVPPDLMRQRAVKTVEEFQLKKEMFGFQGTLSPEQYDEVFRVTGLDVDERQKDMKFVARAMDFFAHGYVRFGKGVPSFDRLSLKDQANLLKLARVEVWFLGAYRGLMKDCGVFYAPNHSVQHRAELERFLGEEYIEHAFQLAHNFQEMNLSFEEVVVLKAVCLTFGDRCDMDSAALVEEIQWRMLRCFLHLLRQNHPGEPSLFYKVMNSLVALRNLSELSRKALSNSHFTDAIRNNATLSDLILV